MRRVVVHVRESMLMMGVSMSRSGVVFVFAFVICDLLLFVVSGRILRTRPWRREVNGKSIAKLDGGEGM